MKVRRLVVAFAALIAGPSAWVAGAAPAHAGGPTSVLLSNPAEGRVGALHHSQSDYQRLVDAGRRLRAGRGRDRPARRRPRRGERRVPADLDDPRHDRLADRPGLRDRRRDVDRDHGRPDRGGRHLRRRGPLAPSSRAVTKRSLSARLPQRGNPRATPRRQGTVPVDPDTRGGGRRREHRRRRPKLGRRRCRSRAGRPGDRGRWHPAAAPRPHDIRRPRAVLTG